MIIANIKSSNDLNSKRRLQQELLELEIANESELERRVKDFKDPNKPIPVAPQFKTNAQLQKDRIEQERLALKNLEELGFDFNKCSELVVWLSGSEVNRLVEFNANFKGIKKDLTETTNPKLLTIDYVKNYLERFFEDLDVSFGRKMTAQTGQFAQPEVSFSELEQQLPTPETVNDIKNGVQEKLRELEKEMVVNQRELETQGDFAYGSKIIKSQLPPSVASLYRQIENMNDNSRTTRGRIKKSLGELNSKIKEIADARAELASLTDPQDIQDKQDEINDLEADRTFIEQDLDVMRDNIAQNELAVVQIQQEIDANFIGQRNIGKYGRRTEIINAGADPARIESEIIDYEKQINYIASVYKEGQIAYQLLSLLQIVIPSRELLETAKIGLPLIQRTDLVKRYAKLLARIKAPTEESLYELVDDITSAGGDFQKIKLVFGKINKMLSFLSNQRNTDAVASLNRNIEAEIGKSGKPADLQAIKQINDRNQVQEQEARRALANVISGVKDLENAQTVNPNFRISQTADRYTKANVEVDADAVLESERLAREGRAKEYVADLSSKMKMTKSGKEILKEELAKMTPEEQALYLAEQKRLKRERKSSQTSINPVLGDIKGVFQAKEAEKQAKAVEAQRLRDVAQHRENVRNWYLQQLNEIDSMTSITKKLNTFRKYVEMLYGRDLLKERYSTSAKDNADREALIDVCRKMIMDWINQKVANVEGDLTFDPEDQTRADLISNLGEYDGNSYGNTVIDKRKKGWGLAKSLKQHFREDERELKEMASDLNRHRKAEAKIDKSIGGNAPSKTPSPTASGIAFKHTRIRVGRGIQADEKPTYLTFGKYVINMKHLNDKNIANFKYPSLGSIPKIRPMPVSDDYKDFIIETIEVGRPNDRSFKKLSDAEREHFERVCEGAGLMEQFRIKRVGDDDDKKRVDRFNVLRGEVLAGNNNENVIKELRGLVVRFMNDGKIARQEGTNMLMELSVI